LKVIKATAVFTVCIVLIWALTPHPAISEATKVRVSAHAAIEGGDVAGAQSDAQSEALQQAIEKVLAQMVPERTFAALEPLLAAKILPETERFISHYQIVNQDVSDRSYTVHLSVTVDTDLLRKNLVRIGVIKEPGSPALAAVFVTVDAPLPWMGPASLLSPLLTRRRGSGSSGRPRPLKRSYRRDWSPWLTWLSVSCSRKTVKRL
jgi:hypothetical protein